MVCPFFFLVSLSSQNDVNDIPDLTFSMDADEEKHILYEKNQVISCTCFNFCFVLLLLPFFFFLLLCVSLQLCISSAYPCVPLYSGTINYQYFLFYSPLVSIAFSLLVFS